MILNGEVWNSDELLAALEGRGGQQQPQQPQQQQQPQQPQQPQQQPDTDELDGVFSGPAIGVFFR